MKRVPRWLGLMPGFPSAEMALLLFVFAEGAAAGDPGEADGR